MPTNRKAKAEVFKPLERNPVIFSLLLLKEMGITEEQHSKFSDLWAPLWGFIVAYRDSMKPEQWNERILRGILSGQATFDTGEPWYDLNQCLNDIWEKANAAPF